MNKSRLLDADYEGADYETEGYNAGVVRIIWMLVISGSISIWFMLFKLLDLI